MKQKTVCLQITNINSVIVLTPYWLQKLLGKHFKGSRALRTEICERKTPAPFSSTFQYDSKDNFAHEKLRTPLPTYQREEIMQFE